MKQESKGHILCVEDDEESMFMLQTLLELNGYKVSPAKSLTEGLSLAKGNSFDLYLLDDWLPDGVGIDLCEKIRSFDSITPILFYSGVAGEDVRQRAIRAGAQEYLFKPVDIEILTARVEQLISHRV
jgi:DNA-binding response OmpR family regulator